MASLEQLRVADFSGELARLKIYENRHRINDIEHLNLGFENKAHKKSELSKYVNNKS